MRPELFKVFEISAPSYFILLLTGFLFATAIGALWARRIGHDPDVIVDLGLATLLAGVVGGRILHVIADGYFWDYVHLCTDPGAVDWKIDQNQCVNVVKGAWDAAKGVCHPNPQTPWEKVSTCFGWAKFWAGGLTYYGGFIGASWAAIWLLRRDKFPVWKACDMAGIVVPLGLGFGRMGCLLAGCCFGSRTASSLGLSFPGGSPASEAQFRAHELDHMRDWSHPVHPTQIYESAMSIAISAFLLIVLHPRKRYDGQVFAAFIALYAMGRFLLEWLRADDRGGLVGLSTSQLIGLALVGVAYFIHRKRSASTVTPPAPPAAAAAA
ncbi:MAG: prolipoprotein diacylglyceryl transferase [Polyangiaceae bacterium]